MTGVPVGAPIASTEIFGLVVYVETFSTEEEAVARVNETVYGLAAPVWTTNAARSLSVPRKLDFGTGQLPLGDRHRDTLGWFHGLRLRQ
ncbi:hypothetical protein BIU82_15355 [Arthrobacter sp. SW1]|nr:hypothetical protein BIU82_15355 [Arthrobacter sp. SW1]